MSDSDRPIPLCGVITVTGMTVDEYFTLVEDILERRAAGDFKFGTLLWLPSWARLEIDAQRTDPDEPQPPA